MNLKYYFKKLELIPANELHKDKIVTKCFLHNEVNGKSLVIDFKRNKWKCYGKCCKSGLITDLLIKFGFNELIQFNDKEEIIEQPKSINIIPFNKVEYRFKINKQLNSYYESRNLDINFIKRNYIYYSDSYKRIYIPCFCNGICYGHIKRTTLNKEEILSYIEKKLDYQYDKMDILMMLDERDIVTEQWNDKYHKTRPDIKYLNDSSLPKNNIVYEPLTNDYINNKITLLTEGSFDSIYANQYGYNAMAIIGGAISRSNYIDSELSLIDYIIEKCKYYNNELILCFDNDKAGINFTKQFRKYSKQIIKRIDFTLLKKPVKDLQDINKQELDFLVSNATIM